MKHQALKTLEAAEAKAWRAKMNGTDAETSTEWNKEGVLELAWRKAADACFEYRKANDLVGLSWPQINGK